MQNGYIESFNGKFREEHVIEVVPSKPEPLQRRRFTQ